MEFLNIFGVYSTVRLALLIEEIGIVQFVYILVKFVEGLWKTKLTSENITNKLNLRRNKDHQKLDQTEANETVLEQTPEKEIMDLLASDKANTNFSNFLYFIEKLKYIFSTILAISSFIFVVFCISKGYSSRSETVSAQFAVAICALTIIFYCEGETSSFFVASLGSFIMIVIFKKRIFFVIIIEITCSLIDDFYKFVIKGLKIAIIGTIHLDKDSDVFTIYPAAAQIHALLKESKYILDSIEFDNLYSDLVLA